MNHKKQFEKELEKPERLNKKVKILERWKYVIFLISFILVILSIISIISLSIITAQNGQFPLKLENGTLTVNIYHHIDLSPSLEKFINDKINEFGGGK